MAAFFIARHDTRRAGRGRVRQRGSPDKGCADFVIMMAMKAFVVTAVFMVFYGCSRWAIGGCGDRPTPPPPPLIAAAVYR